METEVVEVVEEIKVYIVPQCNLPKLEVTIEKMNRKAAKLGCEPIALNQQFHGFRYSAVHKKTGDGLIWVDSMDDTPAGYVLTGNKIAVYAVTVVGKHPHYQGWEFIAALETVYDQDGNGINLLKSMPGKHCPVEYANSFGVCDHCQHKRLRKKTYVLKHHDGNHKVVGSTCIADFLGGKSPEQFAAQAEWLLQIDEACEDASDFDSIGGGSYSMGELADEYLACVSWVIETQGWRSKSSCEFGGIPTSVVAINILRPHPSDSQQLCNLRLEYKQAPAEVKEKTDAIAAAATAWAQSLTDEQVQNNNYLHNCRVLANATYLPDSALGIAASIVATYLREQEKLRLEEIKKKNPSKPSEHVGELKKRQLFTVNVLSVIPIESQFGTIGLHKLITPEGDILTWFASSNWLDEECSYSVKATVIEHTEYRGTKQTKVNRVTVVHQLDPATGQPIPEESTQ